VNNMNLQHIFDYIGDIAVICICIGSWFELRTMRNHLMTLDHEVQTINDEAATLNARVCDSIDVINQLQAANVGR
jgi:hypothetical protein